MLSNIFKASSTTSSITGSSRTGSSRTASSRTGSMPYLPPARSRPRSSSLLILPMSMSNVSVSQSCATTLSNYKINIPINFKTISLFPWDWTFWSRTASLPINDERIVDKATCRSVSIAESLLWLCPTDLWSIRILASFSTDSILSRRSLFSLLT